MITVRQATAKLVLFSCLGMAATAAWSMEITWTRMIGQWPGEGAPLVADVTGQRQPEILIVNRGGQLLRWEPDGSALGQGQDGQAVQLPEGRWTTAPMLIETESGARLVVGNVEGLVVGLDRSFQPAWQQKLPGETAWGKAIPATWRTSSGTALCCGDLTGTVTCLTAQGNVNWTNALGAGPIRVPPQTVQANGRDAAVLVAAGSTLFCLDLSGSVRWGRDLGQEIQTRPEVISFQDRQLIACGTGAGVIVALGLSGERIWECTLGDAPLSSLALLPRREATPLILGTGLWGNLHALDLQGRRIWTHFFRAKTRAAPLVLDANGDGRSEVYLPTFHQHLFVFDENGRLVDDIRLSGIIPSSAVPIVDPATGRPDVLLASTTLLAYRLRPSAPRSAYGKTGDAQGVTLQVPAPELPRETAALLVRNPPGALLSVNVAMTGEEGWTALQGRLTSRSLFELPLPPGPSAGAWSFQATARDAQGHLVAETRWQIPPPARSVPRARPPGRFRAWDTPAYASFSETRLVPWPGEVTLTNQSAVQASSLYLGEVDQGAFIVASTLSEAVRARVTFSSPTNANGQAFGGAIILREVVPTGSVNGERIPDALPALGDAGLITLPSQRAVKVWVSVDAHGAQPGNYRGRILITALRNEADPLELPLNIEVLNLELPKEFPMTLCTWDYVPNRWFPVAGAALDDMARHGVNVFPRSAPVPRAAVNADGELTLEWTALGAELARLKGRGRILFQLTHPPITFAKPPTEPEKRQAEIKFLRVWRDYMQARGWGYADYAFYPLDEPGLDYGKSVPVLIEAARLFREADPKLQVYTDPVPGLSWKDFEQIEPLVDVWAPNMRLVSGLLSGDPRMKRILQAKTVWSYECVSQVKSLSPLRYNRANAWRAKFFGLGGLGFWTHSTTEVDHWFAGKTIDDEYALVYPGAAPVPSVRWEAARDGLEDAAAMALLEQQIAVHRQAGTEPELAEQAEKVLRIALCDIMELSDEAFVESRDYLRAGDRLLWHTGADVEVFRRHRAEIARLTLALKKR